MSSRSGIGTRACTVDNSMAFPCSHLPRFLQTTIPPQSWYRAPCSTPSFAKTSKHGDASMSCRSGISTYACRRPTASASMTAHGARPQTRQIGSISRQRTPCSSMRSPGGYSKGSSRTTSASTRRELMTSDPAKPIYFDRSVYELGVEERRCGWRRLHRGHPFLIPRAPFRSVPLVRRIRTRSRELHSLLAVADAGRFADHRGLRRHRPPYVEGTSFSDTRTRLPPTRESRGRWRGRSDRRPGRLLPGTPFTDADQDGHRGRGSGRPQWGGPVT